MREINQNLLILASKTGNPDLKLEDSKSKHKAIRLEQKKQEIERLEEMLEQTEARYMQLKIEYQDKLDYLNSRLESFIYVPSIKLYVAKEISHFDLTWYQAHEVLHKQGLQMLTIPQFIKFIKYLQKNPQIPEYKEILKERLTKTDPNYIEWLDAYFIEQNNKLHINYSHRTVNGRLKPLNSELLEGDLMQYKYAVLDINFDYWLNNHTKQGLPTRIDASTRNAWFWTPDNERVAEFGNMHSLSKDPIMCFLSCSTKPNEPSPSKGVRAACEKLDLIF